MYAKSGILFSAVVAMTLLTVQAKMLRPSYATERKENCTKILSEECPGSDDVIPDSYPSDAKGIDDVCAAAKTFFPCFEKFESTCDNDGEDKGTLTYLKICDASNPLYDGVRKSIGCLKLAEKMFNETCFPQLQKFEDELTASGERNESGISAKDFEKIKIGLVVRQEQLCFLQGADKCNEEFVETMETLFDLHGATEATAILKEKQALVEKIIDNLKLEEKQKMKLKENLG